MDEYYKKQLVKERTRKKYYGHNKLYSKYMPKLPESAEREYARILSDYMKILKDVLESELPNIKEVYRQERDYAVEQNIRTDGKTELIAAIDLVFEKMKVKSDKKCNTFGIRKKIENLSKLTRKLTVKEWKKAIKATLGIDIREDYYLGEFYKESLKVWVDENVSLIKTIQSDALDKMKEIVFDGYIKGRSTTEMVKQIQKEYGISKRHARLIARDQTAKLNSAIQKAQQQDAGIDEYIWYSVRDGRERDSHKKLHGKTFKWSDPPETDDGRHCHPGEDYQCRCIARPVFPKNVRLPVADVDMEIVYT